MKPDTTVRTPAAPPATGIAAVVVQQRVDEATQEIESLVEWQEAGQPVRAWFFDKALIEEVTP